MPTVKAGFVEFVMDYYKTNIHEYFKMPEQNTTELPDPAKLLKKVLAEAHFDNTDIGGAVFSLLDSLSYDITSQGLEDSWSDATEDLMQEVINILAKDYDEIRTDDVDEEDEDDKIEEVIAVVTVAGEVEEEDEEEEGDDVVIAAIDEDQEEIDEVPELVDTSDLEVETDGQGNQEVANKG
jgi:hypothetical protein